MKKGHKILFDDDDDNSDIGIDKLINDHNVKILDLNKYEMSNVIAAGSFSKIYLLTEKSTNQKYVAKKATDDSDPANIQSFINQVSAMSIMDSPAIIKLIGCGSEKGSLRESRVIVLEYASNGNLSNIIRKERKSNSPDGLTDTKKHTILYGIATAMAHIHTHGFILRDLKPSNVLLDDFLFPKISDFSLATKGESNESSLVGTPVYMPPEVIEGDPWLQKSDVYSFAILTYELVTLLEPFPKLTMFKLVRMISEGRRPEVPSYVPDLYKDLICRCWAQDPRDRPSFEEIKEILQNGVTEIEIDEDEFNNYCDYLRAHESCESAMNVSEIKDEFGGFHRIDTINDDEIGGNDDDLEEEDANDAVGNFGDDECIKKIGKADQKFKRVKIDFSGEELIARKLDVKSKPIDLGIFEKKEEIGEGSFGKVYRAIQKETNEVCAAKVNRKELIQCNENEVNNLSREINILAGINSPLIVKFIGYNTDNFEKDPKPTIITEFIKNGSLRDVIDAELRGISLPGWDQTKKLIIVYGVASGLAYLHAHNILHRDIKPENIFLDEFMFPKLGDFGLAKDVNDDTASDFVGTPMFMSPEIINDVTYTKAGDVYAYSILVYMLLTLKDPFDENNQFNIFKKVTQGYRPLFPDDVPECYQNLLRKCWSHLPEERPTFEDIIDMIKANPDFISDDVDEDEFIKYVESIGDTFNVAISASSEKPNSKPKSVTFKEVSFDMQKVKEEDKIIEMIEENPVMKETFLDLNDFEKLRLITKGDNYKIYEVKNKETGTVYSAKVSTIKVNRLTRDELIHLSREVGIISQLSHPSFLQFVGYSPINFKKKSMPVIISELPINKSLSNLVEMERKHKKIPEWNDTKRLINIYGIANGMSYLHSHKIIHRNLGLNSIFLDEFLLPKIGNFGFSTRVHTVKTITMQSTSGIKGNPSYSSPEVLEHDEYTNASDVYAFGMIVYELMTLKKPFKNNSYHDVYKEIVIKRRRPKIDENIPECYRQLIEVCWSTNPEARPSFEDIERILRTDEKFITEKVDKNGFFQYVQDIEKETVDFFERKRVVQLEDLIEKKSRVEEDEIKNENNEDEEAIENIENEVDRLINIKSFNPIKIGLVNGLLPKKEKVASTSTSTIYRVKVGKSSFDGDYVTLRILKEKVFSKSDDDDEKGFNIDESKVDQFYSYYSKIHMTHHPNIARSFGFFEGNSKHEPFVLKEYFSKSLKEAVKTLDDVYLASIIYEISHAMMILHSNHLIHRNLKPENIFVDSNKHAKLTDFGSEILLNVPDQIKSEKAAPVCMSSELLQNKKYDDKTDVFSFGVVMYFILSRGKAKFLSKEEIIAGQKQKILKSINKLSYSIIKRCLSPSPEDRPSFRAIISTIRKYNYLLIDKIESKIPILQNQIKSIINIRRINEKK